MLTNGMKTFTIIWFGQLVSLIGTAMTRFALLIWAYNQTKSATTVALLGFFAFAPYIAVSPFAGVWVDRLDRRRVMLLADAGAGLMTLGLLVLFATGNLEIWHLFVAGGLTGVFEAFQIPAYNAAITMLLPKSHYTRASGMRSLADSGADIGGPVLAGALLAFIGIGGIMAIDVVTVGVAVISLLFVRIPRPEPDEADQTGGRTTWQEIRFGFGYITQRKGLLGLLVIYAGINFAAALTYFAVMPTMILARTNSNEVVLAGVQAAMGIGGIIGGLLLSVWGGPKRRIHGLLAGGGISFLAADALFGVARTPAVWITAAVVGAVFVPFIIGSNRAIWQAKVAPKVQGRVFSIQAMFQTGTMPLGYLVAGPLADLVFEPAMAVNGSWAGTFGWLVGTGPGAGMGLMFVCTALMGATVCFSGYLVPAIRNVEDDLPDHDLVISSPPLAQGAVA